MAKFRWNKAALRKLGKGFRQAVDVAAVVFQSELKGTLTRSGASNIMSGGQGSPPGSPPRVNTGRLRNSIQINRDGLKKNPPSARVGTNVVYARIQEYGGRITPKKARALAIPIGVEGKKAQRRGPLRSQNLVLIKSKRGNMLLARVDGKKITPVFVLKQSVTLPPRPYFRPTMRSAKVRRNMTRAASAVVRAAIRTI
jgi:phage gpG-like protein